MRHDCTNDDGDEDSCQQEEQGDLVHHRKGFVGKQDGAAADPAQNQVGDEYVPSLGLVVRTVETIHCDENVSGDACHSSWVVRYFQSLVGGLNLTRSTDPGKGVPPSSEPATNTSVLRSRSD